jgi:hypothetical protein
MEGDGGSHLEHEDNDIVMHPFKVLWRQGFERSRGS